MVLDYSNLEKKNPWKFVAIISILILLGIGGYFAYNFICVRAYNQGANDGMFTLALEQTNKLEIFVIQNGTMQNYPLEQVCEVFIE